MAEITRILAVNICRQFFFVTTSTASTCCMVENFQLICYSQRVNATRHNTTTVAVQDVQNGRTIGSMVAVVKPCGLLVQGRRGCRERCLKTTTEQVFKKILACSVSLRVIAIV